MKEHRLSFIIPCFNGWDNQDTSSNLDIALKSLEQVPDREVILIGNMEKPNCINVKVEDNTTISKKINVGAKIASNNILVYMRDYNYLLDCWWDGWLKFGFDWDVAMNKIENTDGSRYRDYCSFDDPEMRNQPWVQTEKWCPQGGLKHDGKPAMVPYTYNKTHLMYISGMYWLAKKQFMLDNPFDNSLKLGEAEDIFWSLQCRGHWNYKVNVNSVTKLLKWKDPILPCITN